MRPEPAYTLAVMDRPRRRNPTHPPIQVNVPNLDRLFTSIDPTPLPDRDIDDDVEHFIVSWAQEFPTDAKLEVEIVSRQTANSETTELVEESLHRFFVYRAGVVARDLHLLLRDGRLALLIGLAALSAFIGLSQLLTRLGGGALLRLVEEGLAVAGWVAMWRPMEIFLYEWWPIRRKRRIYERLSQAPVRVVSAA